MSYRIDGSIKTIGNYKTQFKEYQKGIHLELHRKTGSQNSLELRKHVRLGLERKSTVVKNVIMDFTPDSSKLVIYMREINKL